MRNKNIAKILLVIGLVIAGIGIYFAFINIKKIISNEQAEGVITGFHTHKVNPRSRWPNVAFTYKGDSILSKIDYYSSGMAIGQTVTVIFPAGNPSNADIKSSLWFTPLFLLFFSLFLILPYFLLSNQTTRKKEKE